MRQWLEPHLRRKMGLTYKQIYNVVAKIPRGRVATYGQIAAMASTTGVSNTPPTKPKKNQLTPASVHYEPRPSGSGLFLRIGYG